MNNLPTTSLTGFNALSEPQQQAHRAKIGVRCRAILGQFWQDADTHEAETIIEVEGWMDVLENCSHSEIRFAWRDYQTNKDNRSVRGRLVKPDAGALLAIIYSKRPRPVMVRRSPVAADPAKEPRVTAERANELIREAGIKLNTFGGKSS